MARRHRLAAGLVLAAVADRRARVADAGLGGDQAGSGAAAGRADRPPAGRAALPARGAPLALAHGDARHRHGLQRRRGVVGCRRLPGGPAEGRPPQLLRRLPRLRDRRHAGRGPVPRLRDPPAGAPGSVADRRLRDQPGRRAPAHGAHVLAQPAPRQVSDVVAVAGTQHGTTADLLVGSCQTSAGCPPAVWQQAFDSNLLKWVNRRADETPGPTAWTTVRTEADEVVTPQEALYPTSTLRGATNISIQQVCPGRRTSHIGSAYDSVSFAGCSTPSRAAARRTRAACPPTCVRRRSSPRARRRPHTGTARRVGSARRPAPAGADAAGPGRAAGQALHQALSRRPM